MVRMLAVELFEEFGCEVIEAAGGREALSMLTQRSDVSLMFTDCRMPGMSGPELATRAAEQPTSHPCRTPPFRTWPIRQDDAAT